ncbi:cytochrome c oxidase subunit II [Orrella sp. JC864]|uniref:cytochrome c oxidase subunit II n=1 Tax=Orrella sp. JC864 TaxID=3120298 RepID=UPI00300B014B
MQTAAPLAALLLAACGGEPLSALEPAGPAAESIARAWWLMAAGAAVILLGVTLLAAYAVWRKSGALPEQAGRRLILAGGVVFPLAVLMLLLGYGLAMGHGLLPAAGHAGQPVYRVDVLARQWQWDVFYPEAEAEGPPRASVNVLHIPVGQPVDVHVSSADVIHSFWVPRLGGKIDAIPGRVNVVRLQADQPGAYEGICAEFCGLAHARMRMQVHAHEPQALQAQLGQLSRAPQGGGR